MDQAISNMSSDLKFSNEKLDTLRQDNQHINESIDKLSTGIAKTNQAVIQTFKRVDALAIMAEKQSISQDRHAQDTTEKLLTLERLARRSLFAILFGRDKDKTKY